MKIKREKKNNSASNTGLARLSFSLKKSGGFTLVEIMVAFLIFSIILTVFSSVFLSSSQLQKKAFNIQQAEENANYILESMAKEIRVSKISGPDTNCPSSPAGQFINYAIRLMEILFILCRARRSKGPSTGR